MSAQRYLAYYIYLSHFVYNTLFAVLLFFMSFSYLTHSTEQHVYATNQKKPVFIFDMGGVLAKTDKKIAIRHLGILSLCKRIFWHLQSFSNIQEHFYYILEKTIEYEKLEQLPFSKDPQGRPLPLLMRYWLAGLLTGAEIKEKVFSKIEQNADWFSNETEKILIKNLVYFIFTPHLFIESQYIPDQTISFIKQLHVAGYKLFILSNWDEHSFVLLQEKYKDFFALFDGWVVSGQEKVIKPDYALYDILLKRYNLNPEQCIFIDDQIENVRTALDNNIIAILCTNFTSISQFLSNYFLI